MTEDMLCEQLAMFTVKMMVPVGIGPDWISDDPDNAAATYRYNPDNLEYLFETGFADTSFDSKKETKWMILVHKKFIDAHLKDLTTERLNRILLHEYGHVLTMDIFSDDEQIMYYFQSQLLRLMCITHSEVPDNIYYRDLFRNIYYSIPIEKAANDAVCISKKDILIDSGTESMDLSSDDFQPYTNLIALKFYGKNLRSLRRWNYMYINYGEEKAYPIFLNLARVALKQVLPSVTYNSLVTAGLWNR